MSSPDSSSTMRTVPCIAGCDGPMLRCIGSDGSSSSPSSKSRSMGSISVLDLSGRRFRRAARVAERLGLRCNPRSSLEPFAAEGHAFVAAERSDLLEDEVRFFFGAVRDERLRLLRRVVLAERVALELRVHEDATE